MRKLFVGFAAVGFIVACAAGAENKKSEFGTIAARNAKAQFGAKIDKAEKEYQAKVSAARKDFIAELEKAKADATRTSDLEEAIRIRDVLEEQKKQGAAATVIIHGKENDADAALRARVVGTVWSLPGSGKIAFLADGSIARTDHLVGRWAPVDDHTLLVRYTSIGIDAFEFDDKFTRYSGLGHGSANKFEGARVP